MSIYYMENSAMVGIDNAPLCVLLTFVYVLLSLVLRQWQFLIDFQIIGVKSYLMMCRPLLQQQKIEENYGNIVQG